MSELNQKRSPGPRRVKTLIFSMFWKVFKNEENPQILTPGQLKYTNSLIRMQNGHMSELSQKSSPGPRWAKLNFNFFYFLQSFRKWRQSSHSHPRTTKIYKFSHLDGKWAHEWNWAQKVSQGPWFVKTSIFLIFWKVFENEENPHILTPGQLKYTNLLIWMENGSHEWIEPKEVPQVGGGRKTSFFFDFLMKFTKMKKILIFSLQDN